MAIELGPDFLLIGPLKTGAASICQSLNRHSGVSEQRNRESNLFASSKYPDGLWDYKLQFDSGSQGLSFEAEPRYFAHPLARYRVFESLGKVKVICCLQDPVERFISHVRADRAVSVIHKNERLLEPFLAEKPSENGTHGEGHNSPPDTIIADFKASQADPKGYFSQGEYIRHLKQWQELMTAENVYVCIFEELVRAPAAELLKIQAFLELPLEELSLPPTNPDSNWEQYSGQDFSDEFTGEHRMFLREHYRPYSEALAAYLETELPWESLNNAG